MPKGVEHEAQLQEIRERYAKDLDRLKKAIDRGVLSLRDWAENNPAEFAARRSIQFATAKIGWRDHPPRIVPDGRAKARLEEAMARLQAQPKPVRDRFLRVKVEPNKEAMLEAFRAGDKLAETLRACGWEVQQREQFFVEPKREALEGAAAKA